MNATRSFTILRVIFITAFALETILHLVPEATLAGTVLNYWRIIGETNNRVSYVDLTRFCFLVGLRGWGIYDLLIFIVPLVFIILAIAYPCRWVFVAGSIFAIYQFVFFLFGPRNSEIHPILICTVLHHIGRLMALAGFWVKPASLTEAELSG